MSFLKKLLLNNRRLIRFAIVGFSNFVIISLTVWIMMSLLQQGLYVSNVCAYTLAICSSFYWNKRWVFQSKGGNVKREITLFLTSFGCAYLLQVLFVFFMYELIGLNEYLAQFLGLFIFGTVNFLMNKFVTFQTKKS